MAAAGAATTVVDAAGAAGTQLVSRVVAATSIAELTQAKLDFVNTLAGPVPGTIGGVLGQVTGATGAVQSTAVGDALALAHGLLPAGSL